MKPTAIALVVAVGAASLLEGRVSDMVAGGDGNWFVRAGPAGTVAAAVSSARDLDAARRSIATSPATPLQLFAPSTPSPRALARQAARPRPCHTEGPSASRAPPRA